MAVPVASKDKDKGALLSSLLEGVKGCQSRFGSRTELATEDDESVRKLCISFEDVFLHGLKDPAAPGNSGGTKTLWGMTESLVPAGLRLSTSSQVPPSYWPLIKSILSKHEAERFLLLHSVRSDYGRARSWLRASLNEHSLERCILVLTTGDPSSILATFYEPWAFLRDPELSSILPQTAAGLGSVLFALIVDNPVLDCWVRKPAKTEETLQSPVEVAEVADQFLAAMRKEEEETVSSEACTTLGQGQGQGHLLGKGKRKKKKPHVNVVSFDEDEEGTSTSKAQLQSQLHSRSQISPQSSTNTSITTTPTPSITKRSQSSQSRESSTPVQILKSPENFEDSLTPEISLYSSSIKSLDCLSIYSDCSERLDIENTSYNCGRLSPSQRLKPVQDAGESSAETLDENNSSFLIPLPSFDPSSNPAAAPAPELEEDTRSIASSSYQKFDSSMSISDEDNVMKLRAILDREIQSVATLQSQLAEEKRKSADIERILEARIESVLKDNEILRHQLNKYVGAVQLLKKKKIVSKKGSFYDEELTDEQLFKKVEEEAEKQGVDGGGETAESTSSSPHPGESLEYERKLIQVAEMHGELMEFNTHLQSGLRKRDLLIRRLREELVDLRGPLAAPLLNNEENSNYPFDFNSWDIVDSLNANNDAGDNENNDTPDANIPSRRVNHLTQNERVLINIWIPSAFLTGANTDLHHVYQVFIRIKDTEWNVYRRYSQFYSLHRDLRKKDPVIGSFPFPPKKHLGNKDGKFVEERRRKLQDYLRLVINHTLTTNSILAAHPDKNLLISILPFFGESAFPLRESGGRSSSSTSGRRDGEKRKRNFLFNRSTNSSSGLQTSTQYPQYTGL